MTNIVHNNGMLKVVVNSHDSASNSIPKQLQVLGADLALKHSHWMNTKTLDQSLKPGVYLIRLNLSSGKQLQEIVEIQEDRDTRLDFDISRFSPRESQEWLYFTKSNADSRPASVNFKNISLDQERKFLKDLTLLRWEFTNSSWSLTGEPPVTNIFIDDTGETYSYNTGRRIEVLEIQIPAQASMFVCLPPGHQVKCAIKIAESPSTVPKLDVCVGTPNQSAEALLSLITSGDMTSARTLMAGDAEQLLNLKMEDMASAAIGGYFLLKIGELNRLHDWANNLANLFNWMPDGAIIHAWQLIQEEGDTSRHIHEIRNRLIEAVNRGIPVYTEGLRLLYDGLNMLSYEFNKTDLALEEALKRVKAYMNVADLSQETTSFTGMYPDLPGYDKRNENDPPGNRTVDKII